MYGTAPPQPPHPPARRGRAVAVRVVLTLLPLASLGLLAWVSPLRLGLLRRRVRDWVVAAGSAVTAVVGFVLVGMSTSDSDWQGNAGTALVLATALGTAAYYLVADLRRGPAVRPLTWPGALPAGAVRPTGPYGPGAHPAGAPPVPRPAVPGRVYGPGHGMPVISGAPSIPGIPVTPGPGPAYGPVPAGPAASGPGASGPGAVGPVAGSVPSGGIAGGTPAGQSGAPVPPPTAPSGARLDQVRAELGELSEYLHRQQDR